MPSSHPLIRGTHPTHVVHSHTRADSRSRSRTAAGPQLDLAPFTFARTTANQHLPAAGKFMTIHHARRIVPKEQQHPRLLPRPIRTPEPTTASRLAFGHPLSVHACAWYAPSDAADVVRARTRALSSLSPGLSPLARNALCQPAAYGGSAIASADRCGTCAHR